MEPGQAVVLIMNKKILSGCRVWPSKRAGFFCLDVLSGTGFKLLILSSKASSKPFLPLALRLRDASKQGGV